VNTSRTKENERTQRIQETLTPRFPNAKAYQYNPASIRVRIIDEHFRGLSKPDREKLVWPLLEQLPEDIQADITILLLLTQEETEDSLMNLEFEKPTPSSL
jgi:stress-induced morphogen